MTSKSVAPLTFGTDGWRAVIGEDFTVENVRRVAEACAQAFSRGHAAGSTLLVGYDTRAHARLFAQEAASVLAAAGFKVLLSQTYLPTPALCWYIATTSEIVGGLMLTASHNPAQYLGIKVRMADGGASPQEFTNLIETLVPDTVPTAHGDYEEVDVAQIYLRDLVSLVDKASIEAAQLNVVVDPLYGAARDYLATALREVGVSVTQIHANEDPTFGGLHPEPIPPWTDEAAKTVAMGGYDAAFVTDGDADRLGAIDNNGAFVDPHRIFVLVLQHLVEDKNKRGRVVRTLSGSNLIARQCDALELSLTTTPIGFKWIYEEMLAGDVLIGGEESGGIGIPAHVKERDGLLMTLLLIEMMAQRQKSLDALAHEMLDALGRLEYGRYDLRVEPAAIEAFLSREPTCGLLEEAGYAISDVITADGVKFLLDKDSWLLLRGSGTEPLVRIYAEAPTRDEVDALLAIGRAMVVS